MSLLGESSEEVEGMVARVIETARELPWIEIYHNNKVPYAFFLRMILSM